MLNRWIEDGLLDTLGELGVGCIAFSPLAQGVLTDKYLSGIPEDSRAAETDALAQLLTTACDDALDEIAPAPNRWHRWHSRGHSATRG